MLSGQVGGGAVDLSSLAKSLLLAAPCFGSGNSKTSLWLSKQPPSRAGGGVEVVFPQKSRDGAGSVLLVACWHRESVPERVGLFNLSLVLAF